MVKGRDGLDEADGADGDEVLDVDARVLKPPGDVGHQAQIVLDEQIPGLVVPLLQAGDEGPLPPPGSGGLAGCRCPRYT